MSINTFDKTQLGRIFASLIPRGCWQIALADCSSRDQVPLYLLLWYPDVLWKFRSLTETLQLDITTLCCTASRETNAWSVTQRRAAVKTASCVQKGEVRCNIVAVFQWTVHPVYTPSAPELSHALAAIIAGQARNTALQPERENEAWFMCSLKINSFWISLYSLVSSPRLIDLQVYFYFQCRPTFNALEIEIAWIQCCIKCTN
jgi:hypothetical protein